MSLPHELPPGLPPLPKSLSAAAAARGLEHINHKASPSSATLDQQHSLDGPSFGHNHLEGSLSSTQDSTSDRESVHSRASSSLSAHDAPTSTSTLDTQIALLRREMYSLRQLDLSLLSQLWALNESIQSFRTVLQDREDVSPSPTPSNTNSISSDEEPDDHSFSPLPQAPPVATVVGSGSSASQASTSTSASNSLSATNTNPNHAVQSMKTSKHNLGRARSHQEGKSSYAHQSEVRTRSQQSVGRKTHSRHYDGRALSQQSDDRALSQMSDSSVQSQRSAVARSHSHTQESGGGGGGRVHPQLPPILQQRMRRPPPPPPPMRGGGKSPNRAPEQKLTV